MSERERCPRCGGPLTAYPTRLRCYRGDCMWSSEDEGPKRDTRGRKRRG